MSAFQTTSNHIGLFSDLSYPALYLLRGNVAQWTSLHLDKAGWRDYRPCHTRVVLSSDCTVCCRAPAGVFLPPSPWSWIDPGAFALIGAASFMGGVTRLTISITILMMEVHLVPFLI